MPELPRASRRELAVAELSAGAPRWVAGRLLDFGSGPLVADETAVAPVELPPGTELAHGDLVELLCTRQDGRLLTREARRLVPALRPWPEKPGRAWQRWLQDGPFRERVRLRSEVLWQIRAFFRSRGFLEVDTPALVAAPGTEPHLEPFRTELGHPDGRRVPAYLHTSPELAMKKLLCGGMERIFQLCHVFRNAELSRTHQPEFTMLEWYRAYASYDEIMTDTEELLAAVARALRGTASFEVQGRTVDLEGPFERLPVARALQRYCRRAEGEADTSPEGIRALAAERGLWRPGSEAPPDHEELFFQLLLNDVEPRLGLERPTFLLDYPPWQAALARLRGGVAERVELYVAGLELANGFTELNDAREQRRRSTAELDERARLGGMPCPADEELLAALEHGMPPSGGIALGVDRLAALAAGVTDLGELTLLPFQERFADSEQSR
jgi:elongation factor P--(R)-beta-lysine ligase